MKSSRLRGEPLLRSDRGAGLSEAREVARSVELGSEEGEENDVGLAEEDVVGKVEVEGEDEDEGMALLVIGLECIAVGSSGRLDWVSIGSWAEQEVSRRAAVAMRERA